MDDDQSLLEPEKKRQPGVKRACNECRQQKLRCDVVQDPFQTCTRCKRLNLECKIESNFKRVGKRSKHAEMEKEIDRLRRNMQQAKAQGYVMDEEDGMTPQLQSPVANSAYSHTRNPSLMGSDEAVNSLLTLKRGGSYSIPTHYAYELETVRLTEQDVNGLFREFFAYYHPFLPFLNPDQSPDLYFQQHALLFWSIVAIAARRYSARPSILHELAGGASASTALEHRWRCTQQLLCRQSFVSDMYMAVTDEHYHCRPITHILHDRVTTWAVCNIVAQSIGTGYGQPASTLYDWTLAIRPGEDGPFTLSPELEARLRVERFCDKVSKEMYSNASDPRGVAGDEHRAMLMRVYRREYQELQASILSQRLSPIVEVHLRAAAIHMRLAGFFDSSATPGYMDDLMGLWRAVSGFLDLLFQESNEQILRFATNYIQQMLVAAGFALLKLLRSFFAKTTVDYERGRSLFHKTISSIRKTSVVENDLQWRLAELMVQMWNGARVDSNAHHDRDPIEINDSLQLKVRCRHSMSLVFDSIWRWREEYQAQGRGTLDSLKQATNPDSANESSASSTHLDSTLMPQQNNVTSFIAGNGALTPNAHSNINAGTNSMLAGIGYGSDSNYDFFDPQTWMVEGLLDFNYSLAPPLEGM
ncbi:hypothetical protein PG987_015029 [Apiospora arundinis]